MFEVWHARRARRGQARRTRASSTSTRSCTAPSPASRCRTSRRSSTSTAAARVKGNLIGIDPDPEKIKFGMPVEVVYKDALAARTRKAIPISPISSNPQRARGEHAMSDVYVVGIDMIKFGRFPERTVPELGAAGRADGARRRGPHDQGHAGAVLRQPLSGQRAWSASASCSEIGQTGIPVVNVANACATGATAFREAWMAIKAGALRPRARGRRRADGQRACSAAAAAASGIPTEGLLGSGTMPAVFAEAGMEHIAQVRHDVRAVRQGVGEEPPALDAEPEGHVPDTRPRSRR